MERALSPVFEDGLFRDLLNSYYNMTKFNKEHEDYLRYRTMREISERFGVNVWYSDTHVMYVFSPECNDVLSVMRSPDTTMSDSCYAMRTALRYYLYHLPNKPEELSNALAEHSKKSPSGSETENKALLH